MTNVTNILPTNFDLLSQKRQRKRKKNRDVVHVEKPGCVDLYNMHMGGVDRSDQLCSHKWYKYLFWYIFDVTICNSYITFKENVHRPRR